MQTNQIKYYTRSDLALTFRERNKEQHKLRKHKRDYPALFLAWRSLLDEYEKGHYIPFSALSWDIPAWADPAERSAKEIITWITDQGYNEQFSKWTEKQRVDWCVAYFLCSTAVAKNVARSLQ